jgi:hypothetical protein
MFRFKRGKMLTVTIAEKWILRGRCEPTAEKGDSVYECIAGLRIQSSAYRED